MPSDAFYTLLKVVDGIPPPMADFNMILMDPILRSIPVVVADSDTTSTAMSALFTI
jgi:hypothetical protein